MMFRSYCHAITTFVMVFALPRSLAAQPSSSSAPANPPTKTAAMLFREGIEAYDRWDDVTALTRFQAANALEPRRSTLQNVAQCLHRLGRTEEALETLDTVLATYGSTMNIEERAKITQRVATLEKTLGLGRLDILAPPKTELFVDGVSRGRLPLGKPLRLSAGVHLLRVEPPDATPVEREVTIHLAGTLILELDAVQLRPLRAKVRRVKPRQRIPLEVYGGWLIGSALGRGLNVETMRPCIGACSLGFGVLAGVRLQQPWLKHITWDIAAGYVYLESTSQHTWKSVNAGTPTVKLDSSVVLQGGWASVGMGMHVPLGSSWQFTGHLGLASLFGMVRHSGSGSLEMDGSDAARADVVGETGAFFVRPVLLPEIRLSKRMGPVTIGLGVLGWLSPFPGPNLGMREIQPRNKCAEAPETNEMLVRACDLSGIALRPSPAFGALWYVAPMLSVGAAL